MSLEASWLGLGAFHCCSPGSSLGQGTEILQTAQHDLKQAKTRARDFIL